MDNLDAFYNPLLYWGKVLESFIEFSSFPVSIKDAKRGNYTFVNAACAENAGLTPDEQIGLNIFDIGNLVKLTEKEIEKLRELDHRVRVTKLPLQIKQAHFVKTGFLFIESTLKKPIFQNKDKVIAILSIGCDITPYCSPPYLFSLYKQRYPVKQAIENFLKHLKIHSCFTQMPTNKELMTLLMMRQNSSAKYVAKQLGVSHKVIEEYKLRIRRKLGVVSLEELLIMLRVCHEYQDLNW